MVRAQGDNYAYETAADAAAFKQWFMNAADGQSLLSLEKRSRSAPVFGLQLEREF